MSDKHRHIEELILRFLDGNIASEELQLLKEWYKQNSDDKEELKDINNIYWASSSLNSHSGFNENTAWSELKEKCLMPPNPKSEKIYFTKQWLKIAASLLIILVSGVLTYRYIKNEPLNTNSYSEYNVPRGSRSHIYLPDGSSVWLNAQSTLKYNQNFGLNEREVILEGEAFFEVVRNESKPFLVKARDAVVKVLGTSFNVKAYPEENFIEATVVHGKVQVTSPKLNNDGVEMITLTANQKLKISDEFSSKENYQTSTNETDSLDQIKDKPIQPIYNVDFSSNITAENYTSWKDPLWIIEREPLKELAIKIERRYNVEVIFKDKELQDFIFSGKLKDESLKQVLQAICVAAPIDYTINQKIIIFRKDNDNKK